MDEETDGGVNDLMDYAAGRVQGGKKSCSCCPPTQLTEIGRVWRGRELQAKSIDGELEDKMQVPSTFLCPLHRALSSSAAVIGAGLICGSAFVCLCWLHLGHHQVARAS
jgi:hypothetical protein